MKKLEFYLRELVTKPTKGQNGKDLTAEVSITQNLTSEAQVDKVTKSLLTQRWTQVAWEKLDVGQKHR